MALLYMDGFDAGDVSTKWRNGSGSGTSPATRFGTGRWAQPPNSSIMNYDMSAPSSQVFAGVAMTASNIDTNVRSYMSFYGDGGATQHLTVGIRTNGIVLSRGGVGSTTLGTYTFSCPSNAWQYIELGATINDTTGTAIVRLNGVEVINYTGDTKNGGSATTIDSIGLGMNGTPGSKFDDFYLCDSSGASPYNTFLGDVRVQTLVPNGAGSSTQFTPSSGANYTTVDELPYSSSDYVSSTTTGNRDTYALQDLSGSPTIFGVQNNVIAKKTDSGTMALKPAIKSGASVYYGSAVPLASYDIVLSDTRSLDPNTSSAWTVSGVNSLESGFEVN